MTAVNPIADKVLTPVRPGVEDDDPLAPTLGQKVEHTRERVAEMAQRVKERAVEEEARFEDYIRQRPVKSVLVAAGIGAGIGLVIGALLGRR